jgi:hypothetical protein
MTEKELREKIGIGKNDLVNTNMGLVDIMAVGDGRVTYGFLAFGNLTSEPIEDFLKKFEE